MSKANKPVEAPAVEAKVETAVEAPVVETAAVEAPVVETAVEAPKVEAKVEAPKPVVKKSTKVKAIKIIVPELFSKDKKYKMWDIVKNPSPEFLKTLHKSFYREVV